MSLKTVSSSHTVIVALFSLCQRSFQRQTKAMTLEEKGHECQRGRAMVAVKPFMTLDREDVCDQRSPSLLTKS